MKRMSVLAKMAAGALSLYFVLLSGCATNPQPPESQPAESAASHSGERANTEIAEQIDGLLRQGREVKILLVLSPESVTYVPARNQSPPGPEWFESVARQVEAGYAAKLLRSHPRATVVDRSAMEKALKELELQSSGLVSVETMTRVGGFVGANYIVSLSFARHITNDGYEDTHIRKLIELATSRVLASDRVKQEYRRDETDKPVLRLETLNGRPFVTEADGKSYFK